MKKRNVFFLILVTMLLTLLFQAFFGSYLTAKISTLPLIRKYDLLRPEAPIVINKTEEIRVSDSEDVIVAFNKVKSKLSSVVLVDGGTIQIIASSVNISGDGLFMTAKTSVSAIPLEKLAIRLASGEVARATKVILDPATNVAVVEAPLKNTAPASFGDSSSVVPGQRLVLVAGQDSKNPSFISSFISAEERIQAAVVSSDRSMRGFAIEQTPGLTAGQAIVDLGGEVVGMWDGNKVIPASILKVASANFFGSSGKFSRPLFGFNYRYISNAESQLTGSPVGSQVIKLGDEPALFAGGPASIAGLLAGDVIVTINDVKITESQDLEVVLEKIIAGGTVTLTVKRGQNTLTLSFQAGELK